MARLLKTNASCILSYMTTLSNDQIRQLNMYSSYTTAPSHPLFSRKQLEDMDVLPVVQAIASIGNTTVAASYIMRRYGMFISTQFVMLATYDEMWSGQAEDIMFGANLEYGNKTISMYIKEAHYKDVSGQPREAMLKEILQNQIHTVILGLRKYSSVSPLTCWENVFGFMLWHYSVLLDQPSTAAQARADLDLLKTDALWEGISSHSLFNSYLKGLEPKQLLNTTVRKTCCFSKDVPGLLKCGFCPKQ